MQCSAASPLAIEEVESARPDRHQPNVTTHGLCRGGMNRGRGGPGSHFRTPGNAVRALNHAPLIAETAEEWAWRGDECFAVWIWMEVARGRRLVGRS